jgi:urease accessory protein
MCYPKNHLLLALATGSMAGFVLPLSAAAHSALNSAAGFAHGFAHPFAGIDHVLAMLAVGVFAANLGGRALWAVPLTFMGLMIIGGMLGVVGVGIPGVEFAIALSLIVLGFVVAVPGQWPLTAATAPVGIFAVFHGHAHGTEMMETVSAAEYGLGFVLATGILHLVGIALGLSVMRLGPRPARIVGLVGGGVISLAGMSLVLAAI